MMTTPTLLKPNSAFCDFTIPESITDYAVLSPSFHTPTEEPDSLGTMWDVHVVIRDTAGWFVSPGKVWKSLNHVSCQSRGHNVEYLAYPIDPAMTAEDINGASHHFSNADNTGWMFKHGTAAPHHKHLIDVRKAVMALFQPALDQTLLKWMQSVSIPATAATRLTKHQNLCQYRDDVLAEALRAEKLHVHGYFMRNPHPEVDHVHAAVKAALAAIKLKWAANPTILARYGTIRGEVVAITGEIATPHKPETRWEQAARLKAEKAASESEGT